MRRRICRAAAVGLALMALVGCCRAASADAEDVLKSAAVLGFLRYAQWPASGGAITVGVLGRPTFRQLLQQTLEGKLIQNLPVRVVEYKDDPRCCQLIYFATDRAAEIRQALQAAPARALTIGETARFLEYGGAVNLFLDSGHIAFEASLEALDRCGIPISASLLRLGQIRDRGRARAAQ